MMELGIETSLLQSRGAIWTAREIAQQPDMLRRTQSMLEGSEPELQQFLGPLLTRSELRIVLTGAGTSAFIGECLAPHLSKQLPCRVEAMPTTDIVAAPGFCLRRQTPTLLVSFARSGNSPESVASATLVDHFVDEAHHLVISCNPDGALAVHARSAPRGCTFLLPPEAHDQSFAMTSSFSCMTYAALAAFTGIPGMRGRIDAIVRATESSIAEQRGRLQSVVEQGYRRVVFLGSNVFKGLAREAALKFLELTDGIGVAAFDTPMGFRHGPKTIVDKQTLVVVFLSNDRYTRRYDLDLLEELKLENTAGRILAVSAQRGTAIDPADTIEIPHLEAAEDVDLLFPYVAIAQLLAFHESLRLGLSPDSPSRSGTVNRIVQGVRIHPVG